MVGGGRRPGIPFLPRDGGTRSGAQQVRDEDAAAAAAVELAHFGMAGFDGAFVSLQSKDGKPMAEFMRQLTDVMIAIGEASIATLRG